MQNLWRNAIEANKKNNCSQARKKYTDIPKTGILEYFLRAWQQNDKNQIQTIARNHASIYRILLMKSRFVIQICFDVGQFVF